jgi:hypothetical protein
MNSLTDQLANVESIIISICFPLTGASTTPETWNNLFGNEGIDYIEYYFAIYPDFPVIPGIFHLDFLFHWGSRGNIILAL